MLTWDTNQLCHANPRRFYMAMEADRGAPLTLLPTVYEELRNVVYRVETKTYERLCRERRYDAQRTSAIMQAAGHASRRWLEAETERNDSALRRIGWARADEYLALSARIPAHCFKGAQRSRENDRDIVAQAIVEQATLMVSDNLDTIRHARVNAWALREGLTDKPEFIMSGNRFAKYLEPDTDRRGPLYLRWIAQACLPDPGVRSPTPPRESIERMIGNLDSAGLTTFASEAFDTLLNDPEVERYLADAAGTLPSRARATEMRRVRAVRQAVRNAGYGR